MTKCTRFLVLCCAALGVPGALAHAQEQGVPDVPGIEAQAVPQVVTVMGHDVAPKKGQFEVRADLNVREGPGTDFKRVDSLKEGARVRAVGASDDGQWVAVSRGGDILGFVYAPVLIPATGLDAPGGVLTEGETIAQAGAGLFTDTVPDDAKVVDCAGKCLAPGLVDMRVTMSGQNVQATGRSAVAGGVTSAVCLPETKPVIDDPTVVEFVARTARQAGLVKVYPYGAVTKGLEGAELAEMAMLADHGAVAFTDGKCAVANTRTMALALSYAATFGLMIVQHPEEPTLAEGGDMNEGETATRLGLTGIPREAETIMIERDLALARMTGARLHIAHVSTAESVELIRRAKDRGISVTCDTAPPYFALNETAVGDYRTFAKLSPPLRNEADREAIVAGLKDGAIDTIASDHMPKSEDLKRLPFSDAASGGVGLETLLPITLELVHNGHLGLLEALGLITHQPADMLGLDAGRLKPGAPADLVLFDPDAGWKVDADGLHSRAKNTPFDGRPVQGRVLRTVIDGRPVFERGT